MDQQQGYLSPNLHQAAGVYSSPEMLQFLQQQQHNLYMAQQVVHQPPPMDSLDWARQSSSHAFVREPPLGHQPAQELHQQPLPASQFFQQPLQHHVQYESQPAIHQQPQVYFQPPPLQPQGGGPSTYQHRHRRESPSSSSNSSRSRHRYSGKGGRNSRPTRSPNRSIEKRNTPRFGNPQGMNAEKYPFQQPSSAHQHHHSSGGGNANQRGGGTILDQRGHRPPGYAQHQQEKIEAAAAPNRVVIPMGRGGFRGPLKAGVANNTAMSIAIGQNPPQIVPNVVVQPKQQSENLQKRGNMGGPTPVRCSSSGKVTNVTTEDISLIEGVIKQQLSNAEFPNFCVTNVKNPKYQFLYAGGEHNASRVLYEQLLANATLSTAKKSKRQHRSVGSKAKRDGRRGRDHHHHHHHRSSDDNAKRKYDSNSSSSSSGRSTSSSSSGSESEREGGKNDEQWQEKVFHIAQHIIDSQTPSSSSTTAAHQLISATVRRPVLDATHHNFIQLFHRVPKKHKLGIPHEPYPLPENDYQEFLTKCMLHCGTNEELEVSVNFMLTRMSCTEHMLMLLYYAVALPSIVCLSGADHHPHRHLSSFVCSPLLTVDQRVNIFYLVATVFYEHNERCRKPLPYYPLFAYYIPKIVKALVEGAFERQATSSRPHHHSSTCYAIAYEVKSNAGIGLLGSPEPKGPENLPIKVVVGSSTATTAASAGTITPVANWSSEAPIIPVFAPLTPAAARENKKNILAVVESWEAAKSFSSYVLSEMRSWLSS